MFVVVSAQKYYLSVVRNEFRRHANETDPNEISFHYGKGQRFLKKDLGGLQ